MLAGALLGPEVDWHHLTSRDVVDPHSALLFDRCCPVDKEPLRVVDGREICLLPHWFEPIVDALNPMVG